MRLARARIDGDVVACEYDDDGTLTHDGDTYVVGEDAELLAPCEPATMYCVGRNYVATIEQMGHDRPEKPPYFIKPSVSAVGPGTVTYPSFTEKLVGAGELAAVIDERCTDLAPEDVSEVVRGYTIMNDLDARDQPGRTARKAFDGSGPIGPCVATDVDPTDLDLETRVNGEVDHEANTGGMLFDAASVVSFLSERFTFLPDDVIAFGSPTNVGPLDPGDEVEVWYEGIGTLRTAIGERED